MDYKFLIYPSNEKEMMSVKETSKAKVVKIVQQKKLKDIYKTQFGASVKKFNDTALAGKMIDDYYKSILDSNIPEVYCISLTVRFDLASKAEAQIIEKSFMDYKKELEKLKNMAICCVYMLSQDEFKEIQIYFVPVASGYAIGMSVKNDLIDVVRKEFDIKDNINIIKAMPYAVRYYEKIWSQVSDPSIITEEELEKRARDYQPEDPLLLHSIEVGQLKENMNKLQLLLNSNQILLDQVAAEKKRIQGDLDWIAMTEPRICKAEAERIAEEKRKIEEENRRKEEARLAEIKRKEDLRKAEEARVLEAERLTEQARRNLALRSMLSREIGAADDADESIQRYGKPTLTQEDFDKLLARHFDWMRQYKINASTDVNKLQSEMQADERRLRINGATVENCVIKTEEEVVGAVFKNITFKECDVTFNLVGCEITKIDFDDCTIKDSRIDRCVVRNITCEQGTLSDVSIDASNIIDSNFSYSDLKDVTSAPAVTYANVTFDKAKLYRCDMKRNGFMRCSFDSATFNKCDMRSSMFQRCNVGNINKIDSLFNGTGI